MFLKKLKNKEIQAKLAHRINYRITFVQGQSATMLV
jgi:hypothetical protein